MASKAVEKQEAVAVPALRPTPASTITAEDIAIPRLYMGQHSSAILDAGMVKLGDIYAALNQDDPDPVILWEYSDKPEPGLLFHALHLRKGWAYSEGSGSPLQIFRFDEPHPEGAWVTYNYVLLLPEVDLEMPYKTLFTRSSKSAALKLNAVVARNQGRLPMYANAFRWTAARRKKEGAGSYSIAQIQSVDAQPDHVEAAARLYSQLAPGLEREQARSTTTGDEPEI